MTIAISLFDQYDEPKEQLQHQWAWLESCSVANDIGTAPFHTHIDFSYCKRQTPLTRTSGLETYSQLSILAVCLRKTETNLFV